MKLTAEEEAEFDFLVNMDGDDPVLEDVDKEKAKDVVEEEVCSLGIACLCGL